MEGRRWGANEAPAHWKLTRTHNGTQQMCVGYAGKDPDLILYWADEDDPVSYPALFYSERQAKYMAVTYKRNNPDQKDYINIGYVE